MSKALRPEKPQAERDELVQTHEQSLQIVSKPSAGSHPTACSAAYGHPQGIIPSLVVLTLIAAWTQGSVTKCHGSGEGDTALKSLWKESPFQYALHRAKSSHLCTFFFAPTCSLLKGYGDKAQCCTTLSLLVFKLVTAMKSGARLSKVLLGERNGLTSTKSYSLTSYKVSTSATFLFVGNQNWHACFGFFSDGLWTFH